MLDIVASCDHIKFQGKLMIKTQENGEKTHFGYDLGLLSPHSWSSKKFTKLAVTQCSKLSSYAI